MRKFLLVFFLLIGGLLAAQPTQHQYHEVKKGETLYSIALHFGTTVEELEKYNPDVKIGLKENMTLLIPPSAADKKKPSNYKTHKVVAGETLYSICRKYNISEEDIIKINPEVRDGLKAGQELVIPNSTNKNIAPVDNNGLAKHQVKAGETLYSIGVMYGVSVAEIEAANKGLAGRPLQLGEFLIIPEKEKTTETASASTTYLDHYFLHKVVAKETAYSLSKQYHISLDSLYILNPGINDGLQIGAEIKLPANREKYSKSFIPKSTVPSDELATDENLIDGTIDSTSEFLLYQVKPGDSFASLKASFGVSREELVKLNPELVEGLVVGKYIIVPKEKKQTDLSWLERKLNGTQVNVSTTTPSTNEIDRKEALNNQKTQDVPVVMGIKDTGVLDKNRILSVGLLLPFYASADSTNSLDELAQRSKFVLDFYNGFLLAADTLVAQGMNLDLKVYDTKNSVHTIKKKVSTLKKANHEMIVGPFFQKNVDYLAQALKDENTLIVSPLSRAVDVSGRPNLVNCRPNSIATAERLAALINENFMEANVIIAQSNTKADKELVRQVKARLESRKGDYLLSSVVSYDSISVVDEKEIKRLLNPNNQNVVIIVSENKVFLSDIISKLRALNSFKIAVVGPSSLLQIPTIELSYLNRLNLTITDQNFVDYKNPTTNSFVIHYREKYRNEPSQWAFQGYDIGVYFMKNLWNYGPNVMIEAKPEVLLNSGFSLHKIEGGGYQNDYLHLLGVRDFQLIRLANDGVLPAVKSAKAEEE